MRQLQLLGLSTMILAFVACGQTSQKEVKTEVKAETPEAPENWKLLDEPEYSIQYPDTFELNKPEQSTGSFTLFSKQTSPQDLFRENINLVIEDLTGQNIDLDRYAEISEGQIKAVLTDANIIESNRMFNGNGEYHKLVYTGSSGQFNFKWNQYYWIKKHKAYVLTFTCLASQYDKYVSVGEEIIKTFTIK